MTPPETTVIDAVPTDAMRFAGTAAVSWLAFTNVVDSPEPFHCTVAPEENPPPFTVNVNAGPPAVADAGTREVSTRVELLMEKLTLFDGVPPASTMIDAAPADAVRLAGTEAVTWPEFTNVVDNPEPFHCTDDPDVNPLPLTVSVKPDPPAVALVGFSEEIVTVAEDACATGTERFDISP